MSASSSVPYLATALVALIGLADFVSAQQVGQAAPVTRLSFESPPSGNTWDTSARAFTGSTSFYQDESLAIASSNSGTAVANSEGRMDGGAPTGSTQTLTGTGSGSASTVGSFQFTGLVGDGAFGNLFVSPPNTGPFPTTPALDVPGTQMVWFRVGNAADPANSAIHLHIAVEAQANSAAAPFAVAQSSALSNSPFGTIFAGAGNGGFAYYWTDPATFNQVPGIGGGHSFVFEGTVAPGFQFPVECWGTGSGRGSSSGGASATAFGTFHVVATHVDAAEEPADWPPAHGNPGPGGPGGPGT